MKKWLLLPTELERMQALEASFLLAPVGDLKVTSSAIPMTLSHGTATIQVKGALVKERDAMLDYFGIEQTAYSEIKAQILDAEDRGAKRGVMLIDSPGGEVNGLAEAMDAIASSAFSWKAISGDTLASAAYMLASQCKYGIVATSETSMVGSIGVATSASMSSYRKDIANTDSPKKRPDVATEEGLAAVREELDDIYGILAEKIAAGRGIGIEALNKNYGQGAVMTARTALSKKIIDGIEKPSKPAAKSAVRGEKMTLEELKAQHPELYKAAYEEGLKDEQKRVKKHCELAKMHDTSAIAIEDILAGNDADIVVYARHKDAAEKNTAMKNRQEEAVPPVGSQAKPAAGLSGNDETADSVKAELAAKHPTVKFVEIRG